MDLRFIYSLILTVLPVTELRAGLPLAILWAKDNSVPLFLIFSLIISLNILIIFFIFYFLDNIHNTLMNTKIYKKLFNGYLGRFQKKVNKFEKRYKVWGFFALTFFVAIPLPGTGAWTGSFLSWLLFLNRKRSIFAISLGVLMAGIFILLGTLGIIKIFS